ncbi:MAG: DUF805 domain-containing protein [Pseudomonadota bacterium]
MNPRSAAKMNPRQALSFLFSTQGRITRRQLALGILPVLIIGLAATDQLNSAPLTAIFWLAFAWPLFVATPWKRLHDMGRAGWWNIVFHVLYAIGFVFFLSEYVAAEGGWAALFDGAPPTTVDKDLTASGLGGFSTVLIALPIHLFWLYAIPSAREDNRYGPAPTATKKSR